MRALMILAALGALLAAPPTPVRAADAPPAPMDCAIAYLGLDEVRAEHRGRDIPWIGELLSNTTLASTVDFKARQDAITTRFKLSFFDVTVSSKDFRQNMRDEGYFARASARLTPDSLLKDQIKAMAIAHACDLAYGFTPVLDAPPTQAVVLKHFTDIFAREEASKESHKASLDELQCAVMFMTVNAMSAGNPPAQQEMSRRADQMAIKFRATHPDFAPERMLTQVKSGVEEWGRRLQRDAAGAKKQIIEDLNMCEAKHGFPVTTAN